MLYNMYFSPTGGTKKVSDIISNAFGEKVTNVNLFEKHTNVKDLSINEKDLVVVSMPCYGGVAPEVAINKLNGLKGNNAKTIVVAVYGNRATDDQLLQMQNELNVLGFNVIAGIEALAEHSLARKVAEGRPNENDKQVLEGFVKDIKDKINNNSLNSSLILPGNKPYKEFHGSGTKPILNPLAKCIQCGTCVVQCPLDAISEKKPWETDYDKCISCMHCVSVCPTGARIIDPVKSKGTEEKLLSMAPVPKENKLFI